MAAERAKAGREAVWHRSLAVWLTAGVALFVLLGSLALVAVFQRQGDREERRAFEQLARANAGFLERARLPWGRKLAGQLGEVIGARVFFRRPGEAAAVGGPGDEPPPPEALAVACDGEVRALAGGEWAVGVAARDGTRVVFLRPAPPRVGALTRADTWAALLGFWLLSLGLGMGLARRVTRPLRDLAESLPRVGGEGELPPLPVARGDEIGQLARTLVRTHDSLREERERRRAAERHALLGRMASHLAHEVRNPVAAIRLHAQLLEGAPPAEAAVSRRLIEGEAARIEELLGQWLRYARPAPPVWAAVDLAAVVDEAVQAVTPQARHAGVVVRFAGDAPLEVAADRHRLRQVFGNLLLNAVQALPRGGEVAVSLRDEGPRVAVVVEDGGAGFSASALARAGEPFFSEKEGGMGLGLAVAKDICEAHGGELRVANRPGGGAVVAAVLARQPPGASGEKQSGKTNS